MPTYKAPVDDALFLLNDVFHLERYGNLPGFAQASPDIVEAVLYRLSGATLFGPSQAKSSRVSLSSSVTNSAPAK